MPSRKAKATASVSTPSAARPQIHLVANSHLDPVWLWDWREGMTEALVTVRTMVALMEEFPEMTYVRGESLVYEHVLREDPQLFEKVVRLAREGRWDVVGGTYLQPDTNLPATETMVRQFEVGLAFFKKHFGKTVKAAWHTDSFGHSAGLPEIFHHAGIRYLAFFRPHNTQLPLPCPTFWWEGPGGHRTLAYRPPVDWYGCEHDEVPRRLDKCVEELSRGQLPLVTCFYGLGNHGGGPSRQHLEDIRVWAAAHPEVEVVHSGLHHFFKNLEAFCAQTGFEPPVHRGELNFCLRGTYSSTARIKFAYRKAEAAVSRLEKSVSAWSATCGAPPADTQELWRDVLFNSFHDILPGSSVEHATEEQIDWLGGTLHRARQAEYRFLNDLSNACDTSVEPPPAPDMPQATPVMLFNPHPTPFEGLAEIEACLDYRPIFAYKDAHEKMPLLVKGPNGRRVPHQKLVQDFQFMPNLPWRQRVAIPAKLPPMGWAVYTLGLDKPTAGKPKAIRHGFSTTQNGIANGSFTIEARPGGAYVKITRDGNPFPAGRGLSLATFEDPWGAWGGHYEEKEADNISTLRERWKVTRVQVLEKGPLRAALFVRFEGDNSWAELTFLLGANDEQISVRTRLCWNERNVRLKLLLPGAKKGIFDIPGGEIERGPLGEVPGGRWVWLTGKDGDGFGFASDALYNFSLHRGVFGATITRAHLYSNSEPLTDATPAHLPVSDKGEYRFNFLLTPYRARLERLATELEEPPFVQNVPASPGKLPRSGTLLALTPANGIKLLTFTPADEPGQWTLRLQSRSKRPLKPVLTCQNQSIPLPDLPPYSIQSLRLKKTAAGWKVMPQP